MNQVHISVNSITVEYSNSGLVTPVLSDLSLGIRRGEILALVGPSGCGKTTLLKALLGWLAPTRGTIEYVNGRDVPVECGRQIGYVAQEDTLLPWRTALENVMLPIELRRSKSDNGKSDKTEDRSGAGRQVLQSLALSDYADFYPHQLSGGMKARICLARTIALTPEILLLDEPFASLDEFTRLELNRQLLDLWSRIGCTVVFVTHSIAEAVLMANRVAVMGRQPSKILDIVNIELQNPRSSVDVDDEQFTSCVRHVRGIVGVSRTPLAL